MTFGVFIYRSDSIYDDSPAERYQFPPNYLQCAKACEGDWILYLEPRRVHLTRGYFAIARVQQVIRDPKFPDRYLARIEPGTYLDFANPVPFSDVSGLMERGLLNENGRLSGRAQLAVRSISPADFNRIIGLGLDDNDAELPRVGGPGPVSGFEEERAHYALDLPRNRVQRLTSRIERDRVFRQIVLRAYDERCAITGLKLINGSGRAEVAAAHIRPVEKNGPDIITNGIALSGTAHWMFDRGLISLHDDLEILISRQVNDVKSVRDFINKTGHANAPPLERDHPHPHFLQWHRENCFKN